MKGDRSAFTALMTAHKEELYRFVRRRTPDAETAYDIVQETFVSAWKAIARFDPDRPFSPWLQAIALNKCRDYARRAAVRGGLWGALSANRAEGLSDPKPTPEDALIARDDLAALARAVDSLPSRLRDPLMLTAVDGMSHAEAAAVLKCSVKAIEYRVLRARTILVRMMGWDPREQG